MSPLLYFLAFFTSMLILSYYYVLKKMNRRFPPGPPRLPLIGSLISIVLADSNAPCVAMKKLSMKYGDIFSMQMGSVVAIAINGHEALTKVANSEDLLSHNDESDHWLLEKSGSVPIGLLFALPDFWNETRLFTQKVLRKFGFNSRGKTGVIVVEELAEFCDELKQQMKNGELELLISNQFHLIFFNVVWSLITGNKFQSDDPRNQSLLRVMHNFTSSGKFGGSISQLFPKLIHIFPGATGFTALRKSCDEWRLTLQEAVKEHRQHRKERTESDNVLDEILDAVEASKKPSHLLGSIYTDENALAILQDLVVGGTDTQSHFLKFLIRYLMKYPDIQMRLHDEVDQVVGKNRLVNTGDLPRLTFLQATMHEVLRHGNVVPVAPRKLLRNWTLDNYEIPKGTSVLLNIWSGDHDERFWKNPSTFDPTRFISADGNLTNTDKIMAFGFGKRRCIGEQLAKTTLLLAMTTFIQQFSFHVDPKVGMPPSDEDVHGFTRDTVPFPVVIRAR